MAHADLTLPAGTHAHRLNAFPLVIPAGATLPYRIWAVEPIPRTAEVREKIRSFLWKKALHRPVLATYVDDRYSYAVAGWEGQDPVTYVGEGELRHVIQPSEDRRTISLDGLAGLEAELAAAMLQGTLMLHLRDDSSLWRGQDNAHFYNVTPDRPHNPTLYQNNERRSRKARQAVDIFRGFTYRVVFIEEAGLCLVLDVRTRYVGHQTLASYLARGLRPSDVEREGGFERWVNDYGGIRQSVLLVEGETRNIGEVILPDGRTTYAYIRAKYPHARTRITPEDRAATMTYRREDLRNEAKHYTGAATLLKPQFTTQSRQVRELGDSPAFRPSERLRRIEMALAHVNGVQFSGQKVVFGPALRRPASVLPLPSLLFGPPDAPTVVCAEAGDECRTRRDWGALKLASLREHGPYRKAEFTNPYLVYPASMEQGDLLDRFLEQTAALCREYGRVEFAPQLSSYLDGAHPRDIIAKVKGIAEGGRCSFVLLALPRGEAQASAVYAGVKSRIRLPCKCFSAARLRSKAGDRGKLASYILGNTLGLLVENGARPWGLADPLVHEMQVGFDAARYHRGGLMGATMVGDISGTDITFVYEEIDARERIPAKIVGPFVLQALERFLTANGRPPRSILFQRDGRLLETERRGIRNALRKFADAHPEHPCPAWAVVTVEKATSVPLRIVREGAGGVDVPFGGAYELQNDRVAFLVLAGYPMPQGTPRPVRVEVVDGSDDTHIWAVLRDIFWLAQLNWNSPEIAISLPMTLRFTDQKLERYALELDADDEEDDADDWDEEGAEGI